MNKYELVIVVDPKLNKENEASINTDMDNKIKEYGKILDKDDKGIKKLAYEVKKNKEARYIIYLFEVPNSKNIDAIREIERFCRIRDEILKFITVKQ